MIATQKTEKEIAEMPLKAQRIARNAKECHHHWKLDTARNGFFLRKTGATEVMTTPSFHTSAFKNYERIHVFVASQKFSSNLLQQPQGTILININSLADTKYDHVSFFHYSLLKNVCQ